MNLYSWVLVAFSHPSPNQHYSRRLLCRLRPSLLHGASRLVSSSSSSSWGNLDSPTVLYTDNHLLVVHKPAGWHSVPNLEPSPKCLLTELKRMKLGGGSQNDFLLPLHRIDQPCTGVLLLGKTSKAASRITTLWKKKLVEKYYLCVVSTSRLARLQKMSSSGELENGWNALKGEIQPRESGTRSVVIRRLGNNKIPSSSKVANKLVSIEWKTLPLENPSRQGYSLLLVRTKDGARHVVRAMLAQVGGCPIQGDIRYDNKAVALPDQSVALHAFRVHLDNRLKLGSLNCFRFEAPVPFIWKDCFGIKDVFLDDSNDNLRLN